MLWALGRGEGAPRTLHVSSRQAPAHYCLKPHSLVPMEQVGRQEEGSGRIGVVTWFQGWKVRVCLSQKLGSWVLLHCRLASASTFTLLLRPSTSAGWGPGAGHRSSSPSSNSGRKKHRLEDSGAEAEGREARDRGKGRESCEDALSLLKCYLMPFACAQGGEGSVPKYVQPPSPFWPSVAVSVCVSLSVSAASALLEFLVLSGAAGAVWL